MSLTAIILAAGRSTRMKSRRPKPLHEVCGKPMLGYILDACFGAGVKRALVVVGHGKEEVIAEFAGDSRINWVDQTEQLGTGHAAKMCVPHLPNHGEVLILAGDVPLIRDQILITLLDAHRSQQAAASMATANLDDPTGYGRVVRDASGEFVEIVEQIDCTPQQRQIKEVFPSYYCVDAQQLRVALSKLTNANKKLEYYLTDIYGILRQAGEKIVAVRAVSADDVIAPNTREQLAQADAVMQQRIHHHWREAGVTIVSSAHTYIESGASIGQDTIIHPFTFIGRDSSIGSDCVIGPMAVVPRRGMVSDGTTVATSSASRAQPAWLPEVNG
jgi:bifunctional UDP-N-acetylglucosamine pyrophosphorylase/glucosamine-1-phosphate N-acetyltransferase